MFNVIPGTAHQGATLEEAHRDILVSPPMNKRFDKWIQFNQLLNSSNLLSTPFVAIQ